MLALLHFHWQDARLCVQKLVPFFVFKQQMCLFSADIFTQKRRVENGMFLCSNNINV